MTTITFNWLALQDFEQARRQWLEVYSQLAIGEAQEAYDQVIDDFPV